MSVQEGLGGCGNDLGSNQPPLNAPLTALEFNAGDGDRKVRWSTDVKNLIKTKKGDEVFIQTMVKVLSNDNSSKFYRNKTKRALRCCGSEGKLNADSGSNSSSCSIIFKNLFGTCCCQFASVGCGVGATP